MKWGDLRGVVGLGDLVLKCTHTDALLGIVFRIDFDFQKTKSELFAACLAKKLIEDSANASTISQQTDLKITKLEDVVLGLNYTNGTVNARNHVIVG